MKWFTQKQQQLLTALVTLALTSSTALAMPSGGTLAADGAVEGLTSGELTSGTTLKPTKDSIINWDSFSIAKGETLTIDTSSASLLNRVTGDDISEIYGNLVQTGSLGSAVLINPNGIIIGSSGVVDGQRLVLSTLEQTDEDFLSLCSTGGKGSWTTSATKGAGSIKIEKGAQITNDATYSNSDYLAGVDFYGGTIEVADGVTFTETGHSPSINLQAMTSQTDERTTDDGEENVLTTASATPANTVKFSGTVSGTAATDEGSFTIAGGAVTLDGADIELNYNKTEHGSEADILAFSSWSGDQHDGSTTSQAGNNVQILNSTVKADDIRAEGSTVTQSNSTLDAANGITIVQHGSDSTTLNTTVAGLEDVQSAANGTSLRKLTAETPAVEEAVTVETAASTGLSTVSEALQQGESQFTGFVQGNVDSGYQTATSAFSAGSVDTLGDLASQVDQNGSLDEGAKLAQAFGMIKAVDDNTNLDEEQKKRLKKTVANNFKSLSADAKAYLLNLAQSVAQRVQ